MKRQIGLIGGALAVVAAVTLSTSTASAALPRQDFTATQNGNGPIKVTASGVINATGKDIPLSDTRDRFAFPNGNLIITHVPTSQSESSDDCVSRFHEEGTYKIVSGTKAYRGAEGSGTYEVNVVVRGCDPNKPPKEFHLRIDADGVIDLDS
jgi:hypothetical protein